MAQIGRPPCDAGLILHGGQAVPCPQASRRWVLVAAIIGSSMAFVDGTVVNVAIPAIQRDLHTTAFDAQWVVESYALFLAALLLVGGSLGDHYGRRRIFAFGVALFALASIGCGLSRGIEQLIIARAVQGVGAALLVPGSLALISASFPEAQRGRAIGTWSGWTGITAALGPVLGGFLIDHYSWTWAFLINVPLALVVLFLVWSRVPESRGASARARLDVPGALLATVALGGIVYAFIEAPLRTWSSAEVRGAALVGIAAAVAFVVVQRRSRTPMLPLEFFRNRNFAGANLLTLLLYAALGGGLYFFPLNLIQVQGYGATAAGAALLPFIAIMFAGSRWAGTLVDRFGPKKPLVIGPVIAACGFALFALPGVEEGAGSYWRTFFPAVVVLGIGMTVTVAPLTTTVMNSMSRDQAGVASGINNAVSRVAALLAIAVLGLILAWAFDASLQQHVQDAGASAQVVAQLQAQRDKLAGAEIPQGLDPALAAALKHAVQLAFVAGFRWVMLVSAALALVSALAAFVWIEGKPAAAAQPAS
ncbi:MAG TPA: MFS transporter [Burkholderiaceae bacterium]|nr:MFS transporter [Burkholderiaceae bacterium]